MDSIRDIALIKLLGKGGGSGGGGSSGDANVDVVNMIFTGAQHSFGETDYAFLSSDKTSQEIASLITNGHIVIGRIHLIEQDEFIHFLLGHKGPVEYYNTAKIYGQFGGSYVDGGQYGGRLIYVSYNLTMEVGTDDSPYTVTLQRFDQQIGTLQ